MVAVNGDLAVLKWYLANVGNEAEREQVKNELRNCTSFTTNNTAIDVLRHTVIWGSLEIVAWILEVNPKCVTDMNEMRIGNTLHESSLEMFNLIYDHNPKVPLPYHDIARKAIDNGRTNVFRWACEAGQLIPDEQLWIKTCTSAEVDISKEIHQMTGFILSELILPEFGYPKQGFLNLVKWTIELTGTLVIRRTTFERVCAEGDYDLVDYIVANSLLISNT